MILALLVCLFDWFVVYCYLGLPNLRLHGLVVLIVA